VRACARVHMRVRMRVRVSAWTCACVCTCACACVCDSQHERAQASQEDGIHHVPVKHSCCCCCCWLEAALNDGRGALPASLRTQPRPMLSCCLLLGAGRWL